MTAPANSDLSLPSSEIWWQGVAEDKIMLLRCPVCDTHWVPWSPTCPECGTASDPQWVESAGKGTLYSWVVVRHSIGFPDEVPFIVASVLLDEGAMLYGRISATDASALKGDMPVTATFAKREERVVVEFVPAANAEQETAPADVP